MLHVLGELLKGDMGDDWAAVKEDSKKRRARNREYSTKLLIDQGFEFESKNNGAHLIVMLWSPIILSLIHI